MCGVPYEFIEHTGDTGVRLEAESEAEFVVESVRALLDLYLDRETGASVAECVREPIELAAEDGESLLIDFLNELIFRFDARGFLCGRVEVESVNLGRPATLRATLVGEPFDPARHASRTEVKAATFHDMAIERREGTLRATIVFDL